MHRVRYFRQHFLNDLLLHVQSHSICYPLMAVLLFRRWHNADCKRNHLGVCSQIGAKLCLGPLFCSLEPAGVCYGPSACLLYDRTVLEQKGRHDSRLQNSALCWPNQDTILHSCQIHSQKTPTQNSRREKRT